MKGKAIVGHLSKMAVLMSVGALIGTLLLVITFVLPVGRVTANVESSLSSVVYDTQANEAHSVKKYLWEKKETYTDCIMLQNAMEQIPGQNAYEHAMWIYHRDVEPEFWAPEESIVAVARVEYEKVPFLHEYSRYWHGYLVYLKPLLMVFPERILVLCQAAILILMEIRIILSLCRMGRRDGALMLGAGLIFMKPLLLHASFAMAVSWGITLIALLVLTWKKQKLEAGDLWAEYFLLIGMVTAYFDFLTYPLVTLGLPLLLLLMMEEGGFKKALYRVIEACIGWGMGYAGFWAMKWLISDLTLRTGTIKNALWSIIGRTEAIGGRPRFNGGFYVIGLNLKEYDWKLYPMIGGVLVLVTLLCVGLALAQGKWREVADKCLPLAMVGCIPFAWIIVVQHHSALHARFTFRIIGITAAAMAGIALEAGRILRKKHL